MNLKDILSKVESGKFSAKKALEMLGAHAEKDLGFAHVDTDRLHRRGFPEVIFCPGKTDDQIVRIIGSLKKAGQNVLATRATAEQFAAVRASFRKAVYHEHARAITLDVK